MRPALRRHRRPRQSSELVAPICPSGRLRPSDGRLNLGETPSLSGPGGEVVNGRELRAAWSQERACRPDPHWLYSFRLNYASPMTRANQVLTRIIGVRPHLILEAPLIGTVFRVAAAALVWASCAFAQNSTPPASEPCVAIKASVDPTVDERIGKLNARAADLKKRIAPLTDGTKKSTLDTQLKEVQETLLEL